MLTQPEQRTMTQTPTQALQYVIAKAIEGYFARLGGTPSRNLYDIFVAEIEEPLFKVVIEYTKGNQSRAANLLGLSRGTLRKKLRALDLTKHAESQ